MKRFLCLLLCLSICLPLLACGGTDTPSTTAAPTETTAPAGPSAEALAALDGKKVLFIGNSYTFHGYAVMSVDRSILPQSERVNDKGLFYNLCKANGIQVSVTNWTFGAHNVPDMTSDAGCQCMSSPCAGENHIAYMTDRYYDYVAIQCFSESAYEDDLLAYLQPTMELFRAENPDVKFLLLVPHMAHERNYRWLKDRQQLADAGVLVCDWGGMLNDIVTKQVTVPGAAQQHVRSTYVVSASAEDGHHQNILAGYLTALMAYCAITGDSAVGQPYDFCDDITVNPKFDIEAYKSKYYTYETFTNFVDVFRSEADMTGLQQLVDQYLASYNQ